MMIQKYKLFIIILLLFFNVNVHAKDTNEPKLEIKAYSSDIKIGEPLILEIQVKYEKPNISSETGEIITSRRISSPYLIITKKGQKEEIKYEYDSILNKPLPLIEKGSKGLEYTGSFIAFYDQNKKSLLLTEPGEYSCRLESTRNKMESNTIEINVKPASKQEQKALSILTGEFDLLILESSESDIKLMEIPGALDRFKQVVEQCPDTMLAKMAATRVGIELAREYEAQLDKVNRRRELVSKQLARESAKYFEIALKLPDAFSIREEILYWMFEIEYYDKNYPKAISYLEELDQKYPLSPRGKEALRGIEEVKEDMANDPNWANRLQAKEDEKGLSSQKPLGVALPIAGAAVAAIVIAGLILFSRKKKLNKTE